MNCIKFTAKIYLKKEENKIKLEENNILGIYINAVREKGKANKAVIEIISTIFLIKKYNINILSGFATIYKVIEIKTEKTKEELLQFLI